MTYPAAVVVVAIVVSGILLIKVVPQFETVFAGFGAELPAFTQFVIGISEVVQEWWFLFLIGFIGTIAGLHSRTAVDRNRSETPSIGSLSNCR